MSCTLDHPCGNSLRLTVQLDTHSIIECLNAHSHVIGTPPILKRSIASEAALARKHDFSARTCHYCGLPLGPESSWKYHRPCQRLVEKERQLRRVRHVGAAGDKREAHDVVMAGAFRRGQLGRAK